MNMEVERPETEFVYQLFIPVADVAQHVRVSTTVHVEMHNVHAQTLPFVVAEDILEAGLD